MWRGRLGVPLCSSPCVLLLPQNALLFPELPFYFPKTALSFCRSALLFPGIALLFSKSTFQNCTLVLQIVFFEFLFSWLYVVLVLLSASQRKNICLALVLFLCFKTLCLQQKSLLSALYWEGKLNLFQFVIKSY